MNLYIELRHLRYVIAVADELHFTRAANRIHLAPPSLSKQIKQLEAVLGYALFERKTREVLLTPAGAAFVAEARQSLAHAERAVERGAAASTGDTGALAVGYTPWLDPSILTTVRSAFAKEVPTTQLALHSAYTVAQVDLLLNGTLQAGVVVLPLSVDGLLIQRIWRDMLSVAVPEDHRLAERDRIALKDVQEEPVIWMARSINPAFYDHLLKRCHQLGFVPNIVHEVMTVTEALNLVASRVGVTFVKTSTGAHLQGKGVVFRELAEPGLAVETAIAYRDDNRSVAIQVLVRLLREQSNCGDP